MGEKFYKNDMQKLLLSFMISDRESFIRCQNIIKPEYWDENLRKPCKFILDYSDRYKNVPTSDQIYAETGVVVEKYDNIEQSHLDWFYDEIESFCRHKSMELLILDGPNLLEKGLYSDIEQRSKANMMISLQTDLGMNYFQDPMARLLRMKDRTGMISTGWVDVDDKLHGGVNRGELNIFVGGSGSGKSLFLQNTALNLVQMGLNVIYITLELSEDLVGLRMDAMLTGMSTKKIFPNLEMVASKIGMLQKKNAKVWGKYIIKKMPEAGTTCNKLRSYLKEFEIQTGSKADAIIVDYLDLLYPNNSRVDISNMFTKDKFTTEELRGLAQEFNLYSFSASQLNRQSVQESDFDHSHIAGGISKINTADNVIAIYVTPSMKERGEYQLQFLKTRSSSGVGSKVSLSYDNESLRITNADTSFGNNTPVIDTIKNKVPKSNVEPLNKIRDMLNNK